MRFSFDQAKHGLSLAQAVEVFVDVRHALIASHRCVDGEDRWKAVGRIGKKLYTVVYVEREGVIRFISFRRSNDSEEKTYDRHPR